MKFENACEDFIINRRKKKHRFSSAFYIELTLGDNNLIDRFTERSLGIKVTIRVSKIPNEYDKDQYANYNKEIGYVMCI